MTYIFEYMPDHELDSELIREIKSIAGVPIFSRVKDTDSDISFYCLTMGGGPEGERPGKYLLYFNNEFTKVEAFHNESYIDSVGNIFTFKITKIEFPLTFSTTEKDDAIEHIKNAFIPFGMEFTSVSDVKVEL